MCKNLKTKGFAKIFSRADMIDVLAADYVRTARAKGLRERVVIVKPHDLVQIAEDLMK